MVSNFNYERFFFKKSYATEELFKVKAKELRKSLVKEEVKAFKLVCSFQATVATRGYHVYQNTTWDEAKVEGKVLVELRAIKNQRKLIRIAVSSEHQSTNKSNQLGTS